MQHVAKGTTSPITNLTVLEKPREFNSRELQELLTRAVNVDMKALARETGQTEGQLRAFTSRLAAQIKIEHFLPAGSQPVRIVPNEHYASLVGQLAKGVAGQVPSIP